MSPTATTVRLTSLDQFRGYTMFGMLLVNFLGSYAICPRILKHSNDYCSYADTIMPQFLFAAGFAMRLSLGKRRQADGRMPWGRAIRRILGLAAVAIGWYSLCDLGSIIRKFQEEEFWSVLATLFKRDLFQTLLHIAATSLWILPVIVASARVRIGYAIGSALLHVWLSWWFNFQWVNTNPSGIDGGPLGFLSWSVPALCGTLACDAVRQSGSNAVARIAGWGVLVILIGWVCSFATVLYNVPAEQPEAGDAVRFASDPVLPDVARFRNWDGTIAELPFVPPPDHVHRKWNYWMMSQRCASLSYTTFAAGVSLVLFALFLWACDQKHWRLGIFRTLGTNSLAAYILHDIGAWLISPWFPETSGTAFALTGFACLVAFVYGVCRFLEAKGWYLRV